MYVLIVLLIVLVYIAMQPNRNVEDEEVVER